jgi:hypothetical protein
MPPLTLSRQSKHLAMAECEHKGFVHLLVNLVVIMQIQSKIIKETLNN